jgi:enamine deaminase RidA (YjgF/YER057c/UK114 family)
MQCNRNETPAAPHGAPMARRLLNPPALGNPAAPFSHGVRSGDTIWVSAQAGIDASGRVVGGDDPAAQCRALFERIRAILAEGGATPSDIVMVRGFLKDRSCLQATWDVRRAFFGAHRPASTSFMVSDLEAEGALMSFEVVAVVDEPQRHAAGSET